MQDGPSFGLASQVAMTTATSCFIVRVRSLEHGLSKGEAMTRMP